MPITSDQLAPIIAGFAILSGIVAFAANLFGISSSVKSLLSRDRIVSTFKDIDPVTRSQLPTAVGAGLIAIAGSEALKQLNSAPLDADELPDLSAPDLPDDFDIDPTDLL